MLIYIVVINFSVNQLEPEFGCPVFDSVHTTKDSAEKRCVDIKNGINLTSNIEMARGTDEDLRPYRKFSSFEAAVIPVQIKNGQPISFLLTDTYRLNM